MVKSKALEINVASYRVEVSIDPKYLVLQQVMSRYFGLQEGLTTFLTELSHPYKNWRFIVREARPLRPELLSPAPESSPGAGSGPTACGDF